MPYVYQLLLIAIFIASFGSAHLPLSVSLIALVVYSVWIWRWQKIEISNHHHGLIIWMLYYLMICLTGVWGGFDYYYFQKINLKLLLLIIPLAYLRIPQMTIDQMRLALNAILIVILISTIVFWVNYLTHMSELNHQLIIGKPLWMPYSHHIRYAMLVYFGWVISYGHIISQATPSPKYILTTMYLSITLIGLNVRSGWAMLCVGLVIYLYSYIRSYQLRWIYAIKILLVAIVLGMMMYQIPSIQNKIGYMKYDWSMMSSQYSDSKRLLVLKSIEGLISEKLWLGIGEGQLAAYLKPIQQVPTTEAVFLPHNQWVISLANGGVLAFLLMLSGFGIMVIYGIRSYNYPMLAYLGGMWVVSMVEPLFETQLGLTLFILPLCILNSIRWRLASPQS